MYTTWVYPANVLAINICMHFIYFLTVFKLYTFALCYPYPEFQANMLLNTCAFGSRIFYELF